MKWIFKSEKRVALWDINSLYFNISYNDFLGAVIDGDTNIQGLKLFEKI